MSDTPETDAFFLRNGYPVEVDNWKAMLLCEKLEQERKIATDERDKTKRERDEAIQQLKEQISATKDAYSDREAVREAYSDMLSKSEAQNAKLRDLAEKAIDLAVAYYDGPCERDGAKLRAELDQLKEDGK